VTDRIAEAMEQYKEALEEDVSHRRFRYWDSNFKCLHDSRGEDGPQECQSEIFVDLVGRGQTIWRTIDHPNGSRFLAMSAGLTWYDQIRWIVGNTDLFDPIVTESLQSRDQSVQ
jgi:hypothetical protein